MTESEWLACSDPAKMLEHLRSSSTSERKLRLFAGAAAGAIWQVLFDDRAKLLAPRNGKRDGRTLWRGRCAASRMTEQTWSHLKSTSRPRRHMQTESRVNGNWRIGPLPWPASPGTTRNRFPVPSRRTR